MVIDAEHHQKCEDLQTQEFVKTSRPNVLSAEFGRFLMPDVDFGQGEKHLAQLLVATDHHGCPRLSSTFNIFRFY